MGIMTSFPLKASLATTMSGVEEELCPKSGAPD
jgi:hypothetical protein